MVENINNVNIDNTDWGLNYKKFLKLYDDEIVYIFKELEPEKQKILKKHKIKTAISWIIFLASIFYMISFFTGKIFDFIDLILAEGASVRLTIGICTGLMLVVSFVAAIISGIFCFLGHISSNAEFQILLKERAMSSILKVFGDIEWKGRKDEYSAENICYFFEKNELMESDLFEPFDECDGDDEFKGTYKGIPFRISEITLYGNDSNEKYTIIYSGIVISIEFNKEENRALDETELEDDSAGENNQKLLEEIKVKYLNSPVFMKLVDDIKTVFKGKDVKYSFLKNSLIIAVETDEDVFEIGDLFKPYDDPSNLNKFYDELSSILKLIEYFKLNEKIYSKS